MRTHDVTKQVEYIGDVQNLLEKLSDLPAGGQVLMGPLTYQRIYSRLEEFRIHSLQKAYEQPARSAAAALTCLSEAGKSLGYPCSLLIYMSVSSSTCCTAVKLMLNVGNVHDFV